MTKKRNPALFVLFCAIGIFMFFIPINLFGKETIPIDHIVTQIRKIPYFTQVYGIIIVTLGAFFPFVTKTWNKSVSKTIFSILGIVGMVFVYMTVFKIGPEFLLKDDMMPYVYEKVVVPVAAIVPMGSVFLAFIVSFGLMEFVGHFMRPVMKPIFKTPGISAIDAVASFVGSYSLALLVTNGVYKQNRYTIKEACIIATGFSTVSATFMIITANTLNIMEHWNAFFWITLIVTFIVTAITARLYPLKSKPDICYNGEPGPIEPKEKISFKTAWKLGLDAYEVSPTVLSSVVQNIKDGIRLAMNIAPNIMSIGILSLILAYHTPIFDFVGYIFYPISWLITSIFGTNDTMLFAKAMSTSLADMYVPAMLLKDSSLSIRLITGILCISEILFFSASVPCIMSTEIPITVKDIVIIWFERAVLTVLVAAPIVYFVFGK